MAQTTARPSGIETLRAISGDVAQGFGSLRRAIEESGPLEPKVRELINIAAFAAARIESGLKTHTGRALDAGATPDEIHQALLLTFGSCNGIGPTTDALYWADEVINSRR
jgi:4-carboxymuconolactone decarboxylase